MRIFWLMLATLIWGFGFVATRWTLASFDPVWSNSMRFVFAAILSLPYLVYRRKVVVSLPAAVCSMLLLGGLQLQTVGIRYTTLAKSGFFTTFYAIFTPLLLALLFRQRFHKGYWLLLGVSIIGIALLCDLRWTDFNIGDAFILGSALLFAMHIIAIDQLAQDEHPVDFNLQQCLYVGVLGVPLALAISGTPSLESLWSWESLIPPGALAAFLFLSLFSSIGAFTVQVYVQQEIPPHIVSLIFLTESVFAGFFGWVFFGERLSMMGMGGALLILLSVAMVPLFTQYEKKSAGASVGSGAPQNG